MFHIIASGIWVLAAWRFGDWRHWVKYHTTILYFIVCDLLHNFLIYQQPLWLYTPTVIPNHTLTNLLVMLVIYTCTILIYLPHYPKGWKQVPYLLLWVAIWFGVEVVLEQFELIKYYRSWSLGDSLWFNGVIFVMLILHHRKPLLTYLLTALAVVVIMYAYDLSIYNMQ